MIADERSHPVVNPLRLLSDYLVIESPLHSPDVIFVLGGRPERKQFGLDLFRRERAERIILSVGRYEVRHTASLIVEGEELRSVARSTPARQRHFFVDYQGHSCRIMVAPLAGHGTYHELSCLAGYLDRQPLRSITFISTSIHLRRVRYSCRRIRFFADKSISFLAVPEVMSSFQRAHWWTRFRNWRYVVSEYLKLAGYSLRYRATAREDPVAHESLRD